MMTGFEHGLLIVIAVLLVMALITVAWGAFMNNLEKKQYVTDVAAIRLAVEKVPLVGSALAAIGLSAPAAPPAAIPAGHTVTTTIAVPLGMILGVDNVLLQPVTPDVLFAAFKAACAAAALAAGSYTNAFGTWNQMEWLRRLDAKTFAGWCATAAALPGINGAAAPNGGSTVGWLKNLTPDGQGFFMALGAQTPPIVIPATDPRS